MTTPHRLDPPAQFEAARRFGKLMAQGIVEYADVLPLLYRAAINVGAYAGCRRGLRCRLAWTLRESADHWRRERDRAEWLIRQEIGPMLAALKDAAEIVRRGHSTNERMHEPLLRSEVVAIVEGEMAAHIARVMRSNQPRRRRRHAR